MVAKVKGSLVLARLLFLRSQGTAAYDRVFRRLSSSDQAALRGLVLETGWYPADLLLRLESTIAALLPGGKRIDMFQAMGRFSAERALGPGGPYHGHVRPGDPHHLLEATPAVYAANHSSGRRTVERTGPREAVVRTFDAEDADADDCFTTVAWLRRAIELCGGRGVHVDHTRCRAAGAPHCEYRCTWA